MTDTDDLALDGLGLAGLDHLASHFAVIAGQLPDHPTAAAWGDAWLRRVVAEVDSRMDLPRPVEPEPPGVDTLTTAELGVIADRFSAVAAWCELAGTAEWARRMVCTMQTELARRTDPAVWEQSRFHAQSLMIDAEEQRRAREGKPPPDTSGLPSWREISGGD
jgi:hypothetical protein